MRGRTSSNNARARLRSAGYKCSLCGRRMVDAEALKRHNKTIHNISSVRGRNKQVPFKTNRPVSAKQQVLTAKERREKNDKEFDDLLKDDIAKTKVIKKKKMESRTGDIQSELVKAEANELKKDEGKRAKTIADTIQYESTDDSEFRNGDESSEEIEVPETKCSNRLSRCVEFECPVCLKKFSAYFTTLKHIQKAHCVNSAGVTVPPCSPELVKPVRVEQCVKCGGTIRSVEPHVCTDLEMTDEELSKASFFLCSACHQGFISMRVFDLHVAGLHSEGVHSLFFPTKIEFTNWRLEMERDTKTKYFVLGEYDNKKIYRCNYAKENKLSDKTTAHLCPSSMVIQEFSKGIQVHFYKDHYDHAANDYDLFVKYKKYSITSFLKRAENYNVTDIATDESDLYMQFKILMENIVLDAAKINIQNLNVLVEKALEMTSILTTYEEEIDECKPHPKPLKMSDHEISEALQDTRKRKMSLDSVKEFSEVTTKTRRKSLYTSPSRGSSPVILNSFSLATKDFPIITININEDNVVTTADVKPEDIKPIPAKVEVAAKIKNNGRVTRFSQSTSFNDTYKDFVDKTIQATIAADKSFKDKGKKRSPRNAQALKTKIGQFKPSISPKTLYADITSPELVPKIKSGSSEPASKIKSSSSEHALKIKRNSSDPASKIKSNSSELASKIKNNSTEPASKIKSISSEPALKIKGKSSELASKIKSNSSELASKIKSSSSELASKIKSNSSELASKIKSNSSEPASKIKSNSSELASKIKSSSSEVASKIKSNSSEPASKIKVSNKAVKKLIISPKVSKVNIKEATTTPKVPDTPKAASKVTKSKVQPPKHNAKVKVKSFRRIPDFEYEIREQENDCNILILKI